MRLFFVFLATAILLTATAYSAPNTAFTYQGMLTDPLKKPLSGSYDMTFNLFAAETGGMPIAETVSKPAVSVQNGVFSVSLDFGLTVFNGERRWLEVTVGTDVMAPRSEITNAPYAMFARTVPWSGVTGVPTTFPPTGTAGGDLTGTYPNPAIAADAVGATKLANDAASLNKVSGGAMTSSGGNIGIGTTTPGFPLTFPDTLGAKISLFGQSGNHHGIGVGYGTLQIYNREVSSDVVFGYGSSDSLTETARIKGTGQLSATGDIKAGKGLSAGTNALPSYPLQVYGDSGTLDQQNTSVNGNLFNWTMWQSFTAGADGTLSAVELLVGSRDGVTPWTATLTIYSGEGTGGTVLSTQAASGDPPYTARIFRLTTPVSVTSGQQYTIVLTSLATLMQWRLRNADVYAGGRSSYSSSYDMWFRTYLAGSSGQPALIVQPETLNVGIRQTSPGYPLSFADALGDKISLYGQSGAHYGFGIQSSLLQIYSSTSGTDIAFGYGESEAFTETMRIKGNGNVGIGVAPTTKLDVAGIARMTGFQLGTTATAGQVLTANATGVGTWQTPAATLPPSGPAGGDLTGTYPNPTIGTGKVDSTKILDGAVALTDLAANSVDSTKLVDGSVALVDLAANSVNSSKVVDASIASADLTSDAASLNKVSGGAMTSDSGKIGIGTSSPIARLSVSSDVYSSLGFTTGTNLIPGGPLQVHGPIYAVDQEQTSAGSFTHATFMLWQSFTAGVDGNLAAVELFVGSVDGLPWQGELRIYEGEGTGGTILGSRPVSGNAYQIRTYPLESGIAATTGAKYTIAIAPLGGADIRWRVNGADVYAGGRFIQATWDAYFRTYIESATSSPILVVKPGTQNVGIGTSTPGFPLTFANALGDKLSLWGQSGAHYGFGIQSNLLQMHTSASNADIAFGYGESAAFTETMRIKGNGNVGIGTSSPAATLHVSGTSILGGTVGINTSTPGYTLHVAGTMAVDNLPQGDRRNVQWDTTTHQFYQAVSSQRYKQNIAGLKDDFAKFLQLEPKTFTYKNAPEVHEIGYIAEDVDALGLKDLVHYDEQGRPDALKYEKMILYLNEIAKNQEATIDDLKRQVDDLKRLVSTLLDSGGGKARQ